MFRTFIRSKKGFSLAELMVVVVIIGILVAIAVPVYNDVTSKAQQTAYEANARTLNGAVSMWVMANPTGNVPTSLTSEQVKTALVPNHILEADSDNTIKGLTWDQTSGRYVLETDDEDDEED